LKIIKVEHVVKDKIPSYHSVCPFANLEQVTPSVPQGPLAQLSKECEYREANVDSFPVNS